MPGLDQHALDQLRWWVKLPPTNLIARGDAIRFHHALYLIIHQVATVLFSHNGNPVSMTSPSTLSGCRPRLDDLAIRPDRCGMRLEQMVTASRMDDAWAIAVRLIADVIAFVDGVLPTSIVPAPRPARSRSLDELALLAPQVAQRYRGLTGLEAIALTGSLARGYADGMSDIDLSVYCQAVPSHDARARIAAGLPGVSDVLIEPACDTAWIDGILVHVRYWLTSEVEEIIAAFPDPPRDAFLAEDLQVCVPLYDGSSRLREWKARVQMFSSRLKAALLNPIQRRRPTFARAWASALAAHDRIHLYCLANQAANDWLIALFAVNDRFLTTPRWCHDEMRRFAVIPAESGARLCGIVGAIQESDDAGRRWNELERLWEELGTIADFRFRIAD